MTEEKVSEIVEKRRKKTEELLNKSKKSLQSSSKYFQPPTYPEWKKEIGKCVFIDEDFFKDDNDRKADGTYKPPEKGSYKEKKIKTVNDPKTEKNMYLSTNPQLQFDPDATNKTKKTKFSIPGQDDADRFLNKRKPFKKVMAAAAIASLGFTLAYTNMDTIKNLAQDYLSKPTSIISVQDNKISVKKENKSNVSASSISIIKDTLKHIQPKKNYIKEISELKKELIILKTEIIPEKYQVVNLTKLADGLKNPDIDFGQIKYLEKSILTSKMNFSELETSSNLEKIAIQKLEDKIKKVKKPNFKSDIKFKDRKLTYHIPVGSEGLVPQKIKKEYNDMVIDLNNQLLEKRSNYLAITSEMKSERIKLGKESNKLRALNEKVAFYEDTSKRIRAKLAKEINDVVLIKGKIKEKEQTITDLINQSNVSLENSNENPYNSNHYSFNINNSFKPSETKKDSSLNSIDNILVLHIENNPAPVNLTKLNYSFEGNDIIQENKYCSISSFDHGLSEFTADIKGTKRIKVGNYIFS